MQTVTPEMHVADIVSALPESSDLFRKLRIDFCCGGKVPLRSAVMERGLEEEHVMTELLEIQARQELHQMNEVTESDPRELIVHIQQKYHEKLRDELPALTPFVTKLAKVHGERYPYVMRLQDLYRALKEELIAHTDDEDHNVFPAILSYIKEPTVERLEALRPHIEELEDEHETAGTVLKEMREITNGFTPPDDACNTHRLVLKRLENLEKDTFQHIHLENNVLFEQVRQAI